MVTYASLSQNGLPTQYRPRFWVYQVDEHGDPRILPDGSSEEVLDGVDEERLCVLHRCLDGDDINYEEGGLEMLEDEIGASFTGDTMSYWSVPSGFVVYVCTEKEELIDVVNYHLEKQRQDVLEQEPRYLY